jgi:YD repeat-containing protein
MRKVISVLGMKLPVASGLSRRSPAADRAANALVPACLPPPADAEVRPDHQVRYRYDAEGRLATVEYPDRSSQSFDYDRHGNLTRRRTPAGRILRYGYDARHRLRSTSSDRGEGAALEYSRDTIRSVNSTCSSECFFDRDRRVVAELLTVDGVTFRTDYDYDSSGRCVGIRPPGSEQWLRYDADHERQILRVRSGNGHEYVTHGAGETHFSNGVRQIEQRDAEGRIERIVAVTADGQSVLDLRYRFNERWQIEQIADRHFIYDEGQRLIEWHDGAGPGTRLTYDAGGNRLTEQSPLETIRFAYDECDRLLHRSTSDGSRTDYIYDRDNNRIGSRTNGHDRSYQYDSESRLTAVFDDGVCVAEYAYDASGRRIKKIAGGDITICHYDRNGQLLAETDARGNPRATYLWIGLRCVARIKGAVGDDVAEFYHNDHLGSVRAVTSERGEITGRYEADVFGRGASPFFARKKRDGETGFYDFGARLYDPACARFLTQDTCTGGPDDWRILFDAERDFWGARKPRHDLVHARSQHPDSRNRYAFCLNDPVNHIDLDGHSAWWFFLTIPSSLTWALPNTAIGLLVIVGNILMEFIGWVIWLVICLIKRDFALKHYPWGNVNPSNPFDTDERAHFWISFDGSTRLGVPWALLNGSFFVWRPYTLGNIIFIEDSYDNGLGAATQPRYVVPKDPDVQLTALEALRSHEMQHVFQYAYLGSLFHALPVPPLVRLITGAIQRGDLTERDKWWERIDLGGVAWTVGLLVHFLSFKLLKPSDVQDLVNPAVWWSTVLPFKWVELVSNAWNINNWLPLVGFYQWDSKFFFDQNNSFFERDAGAHSGDVYQTVVEVERSKIVVGQFTRVVGADQVAAASPTSVPRSTVSFSINPAVTNVGPAAAGPLNPAVAPHRIDLDSVNPAGSGRQVVNASGFYFHSLLTGTFSVEGTGSSSAAKEKVTIEVKDIEVVFNANAFVCQAQTIRVKGDSDATYSIRLVTNTSGGTISGMEYAAGTVPGVDTVEVVANYSAVGAVFAKYGDNGLAGFDYVLKAFDITVSEPTITPDTPEVFVGGIVTFTIDHAPPSATSTAQVPGSQFNLAKKQFIAGKGPIPADTVETVTFDYGCRQFTRDITVKPITASVTPSTVNGGETAQITVTGGVPPLNFVVSDPKSTGPSVDSNGRYTAGSQTALVIDTVTITDRKGEGGRARVEITVQPMTAAANPPAVAVNDTSTITAASGVTPFSFAITNRESTGSTVNTNGEYRAGTTPGVDTITVTDRKGTRVTVTVTVT